MTARQPPLRPCGCLRALPWQRARGVPSVGQAVVRRVAWLKSLSKVGLGTDTTLIISGPGQKRWRKNFRI